MIRKECSGLKPWPGLSPDIVLCTSCINIKCLQINAGVINPAFHPWREGEGRKNTPSRYLQIRVGLISHLALV